MIQDISGLISLPLSKIVSPNSYFSRMLKDTLAAGSYKSSLIWKKWVTGLRSEYSQRLKSARLIREKECLSWATPNTMDVLPSRSYEAMKRHATIGGRKNRERPGNLREQIDPLMCQAYQDAKKEANWPTPRNMTGGAVVPGVKHGDLNAVVAYGLPAPEKSSTNGKSQESWPTPRATESTESTESMETILDRRERTGQGAVNLTAVINQRGKLNPNWVESLMGLPTGQTALDYSVME
jgi:hypothetical protein